MDNNVGNGWAWPGLAKKAHYFVDGRSLCNHWMLFSVPDPDQEIEDKPRRIDCVTCWRKASKLKARKGEPTK
jgi:hypothetical protein